MIYHKLQSPNFPVAAVVVVVNLLLQLEYKHKMHQYNMQKFPEWIPSKLDTWKIHI